MFDVNAKSQLLEDPPLGLDHLVLERDVVPVQNHRLNRPKKSEKNETSNAENTLNLFFSYFPFRTCLMCLKTLMMSLVLLGLSSILQARPTVAMATMSKGSRTKDLA